MKLYYIYFRGTRSGEYIKAVSMKAAKAIFATHNGVSAESGYIAGRAA